MVALIGDEPQRAVNVDSRALLQRSARQAQQRVDQFGLGHGLAAGGGQRVGRLHRQGGSVQLLPGCLGNGARILDALIHGRDGVVQRLLAGYVAQHLAVGLHAQQVRLCQRRAEQHNAPGGAQRHHGGANGPRGPRAAPGRPGCGVRLLQRLQQHQQPPGQPAQQQAQQPQQPAPGADHLIFNKKADRIQLTCIPSSEQ